MWKLLVRRDEYDLYSESTDARKSVIIVIFVLEKLCTAVKSSTVMWDILVKDVMLGCLR